MSSMLARQQLLEPETVDGVGVAAADLHDANVPVAGHGLGDLGERLTDQDRIAELVDEFHSNWYPSSSCIASASSPSMRSRRSCSFAASELMRLIAKPT